LIAPDFKPKMRWQENSTKREISKKIKQNQGGKSEKTSPK